MEMIEAVRVSIKRGKRLEVSPVYLRVPAPIYWPL